MCEIADFAIPTSNFWKHQEKDVCCCIPVSVVCLLSTYLMFMFWSFSGDKQQLTSKNTISRPSLHAGIKKSRLLCLAYWIHWRRFGINSSAGERERATKIVLEMGSITLAMERLVWPWVKNGVPGTITLVILWQRSNFEGQLFWSHLPFHGWFYWRKLVIPTPGKRHKAPWTTHSNVPVGTPDEARWHRDNRLRGPICRCS